MRRAKSLARTGRPSPSGSPASRHTPSAASAPPPNADHIENSVAEALPLARLTNCVPPTSGEPDRAGANIVPRKAHDLRHFLLNVIFVSLLDFLTNACPHADPVSDHEPRQLVAVDQDDPLRSWRHAVSCSSREYCRGGKCAFSGTGRADSSSFHEHAIDANEFVDNQIVGKYRTSSAGALFRVLKVSSPDSGTRTADSKSVCRKRDSGRVRRLNELIS